ncbi:hypothetical protein [Tenacibaculum piscium]|uniref:hypothetical protein n=1 Tax=Tenacibaculum piscium TaxID=1458515 RepID=UPI001F2D02C7|nr:hypothetical protein [Tenacibaculum piscium]
MTKKDKNIEYALNMSMTKITICQQEELDSEIIKTEFNDEFPCHIYMVVKRPRVTLIPEKCEFNKGKTKLTFRIQDKFEFTEKELLVNTNEDTSDYIIKSEFPHSKFHIYSKDEKVFSAKSSLLYFMLLNKYSEQMNCEILYIGQSFGKNGERQAPKRLKNHSTLQSIYSTAIQNNPDKEIWLLLLSFERSLLTVFDGKNKISNQETDLKKATKIIHMFSQNELSEKEMINFTEAGLIKYFQPKYNIIYKENFPNPAHSSYKECYDLDVNSISFDIETDTIKTKLFTEKIKPSFNNIVSYKLENKEKRKSLFQFGENLDLSNDFFNIKIN